MVRVLASHARGRRFESYCLYHAKGTRFRVPFCVAERDENHARRRGMEERKKNKSRVVRARAKPDALPRGPLRGFGKYLLSLPKRG